MDRDQKRMLAAWRLAHLSMDTASASAPGAKGCHRAAALLHKARGIERQVGIPAPVLLSKSRDLLNASEQEFSRGAGHTRLRTPQVGEATRNAAVHLEEQCGLSDRHH